MPPPIPVELHPQDPAWAATARRESARLHDVLGDNLVTVHHVGSTTIPAIRAKPIIDLIPVVISLTALDDARTQIEALGYAWWSDYGLPGRRYCTLDDPATGRRIIQLHCYEDGSPEIDRHVAFRDYLRARPDLASAYDAEKSRCRDLNPRDSHAYTDCKNAWIRRIEREALDFSRASGPRGA
jgi:GrpB-like predicted nucleotidyltransferase (UPF0157 family)